MCPTRTTVEDDPRSSRAREELATEPQLFLVLECDRIAAGGARYSLAGTNTITIGRGTERSVERIAQARNREVFVRVPSQSMSSTHARLTRSGASWTLEDLASRNGTYVNGERVAKHAVRDGDILELGRTFFILRVGLLVPSEAPVDLDYGQLHETPAGLATLIPLEAHGIATFRRIAASDVPVLLLGETGTGKELLARAMHDISGRSGRFVAVNCGGLSPSLAESQLFGHVKGSFPGAVRDNVGFVRAADRGTLFLDQVGDLTPAMQATLLRALEEAEVVAVGAAHPVKVDARIVAATHKPVLPSEEGHLRTDLLARLAGYTHRLTPLAGRREDMGLLTASILGRLGLADEVRAIPPGAFRTLLTHSWPMNVRELRQALKTAAILAKDGVIDAELLPTSVGDPATARAPNRQPARSERRLSEEEERLRPVLVAHLEACRGNVTEVGRLMGKAPTQIHRWLKRFGLKGSQFKS